MMRRGHSENVVERPPRSGRTQSRLRRSCVSPCFGALACTVLVASGIVPASRVASADLAFPVPTIPLLNAPPGDGWVVSVGAQLQGSPGYVGSSKFSPGGSPIFAIRRPDEAEAFSAPDDNLQISLFGNRQYSAGFVGNVDFGRYRDGDRGLTGLNKIRWAPEAGGFLEYWPIIDRLRLRGELRYGFGTDGFISELGADWVERYRAFTLSFGPRAYLGDDNYMMNYFGVTPQEARMNGTVRPYKIGAGLQAIGVEASLRYRFNASWEAGVFGQYNRLGEEAARSPVTRKFGSADQIIFGLNLKYSFRLN